MADQLIAASRNSQYKLITITEVNTAKYWVEGIDQSNSPYRCEWYTHGPVVTAPEVGEKWIISRVNSVWKMMWRYETENPQLHLAALLPGDKRIEAKRLHLLASEIYINNWAFENVRHIYNEVPAGDINGSNKTFRLSFPYKTKTIRLYHNGLRITEFAESSDQKIIMDNTPQISDTLIVDYDAVMASGPHGEAAG